MAAVVLILALVTRSSGGEGPLIAEGDPIGIAQPAAVGQAISVSGPIVLNPTDRALVLDRVELVGLQRGVYPGAYVLPWPPSKVPFTGALTYRVPRNGRVMFGEIPALRSVARMPVFRNEPGISSARSPIRRSIERAKRRRP